MRGLLFWLRCLEQLQYACSVCLVRGVLFVLRCLGQAQARFNVFVVVFVAGAACLLCFGARCIASFAVSCGGGS